MKTIAQIIHNKKFPLDFFDENTYLIYFEDSTGYWSKREYDSNGTRTYYESSHGLIIDNRY